MYDIEVEDNHNFVVNGLCLHNCHMLSQASFNALLKTLEEPPDRVVFVLATTDPQRVLPTIISRCQRFDFRRIELDAMVQHLSSIALKESITINPEAVQLVAQISQGGLRDAESLLDQLSLLEGEITSDRVWDLVGAVPERDLLALVQAIAADEGVTVLDRARHLLDRGREPLVVLQNLTSFYRDMLIAKTSPDRIDLVAITPPTWTELCAFVQPLELSQILAGQQHLRACEPQVKNTTQPRLWLEVTLLGLLPSAIGNLTAGSATPPKISLPPSPSIPPAAKPVPETPRPIAPKASPVPETAPQLPAETAPPAESLPAHNPAIAQAETNGNSNTANGSPKNPLTHPPTHSPTHSPTHPSPPPQPIEPQQDWSELWDKILSLVQPYSTQTMLRQQCQLIHFSGQEARIGARSQNLFKMAKDRLPNIEAAFTKLYEQPIRVTLEVLLRNESAPAANPPANPATNPPANPSPPVYPPTPPAAPPQVRETSQNGFNAAPGSGIPTPPVSPDHPPAAIVPPADAVINRSSAPDLPPEPAEPVAPPTAPEIWQIEDEVTRAAKSLAQMFNGQIVSLDSSVEGETNAAEEPASLAPPSPEALDSDPDGDVPF